MSWWRKLLKKPKNMERKGSTPLGDGVSTHYRGGGGGTRLARIFDVQGAFLNAEGRR